MRIKKNDTVILLAGKDKGKKGKVMAAMPERSRVIVEGLNMAKRHRRARKAGQKGEIISIAMPIHISKVALLDPKSGKATRVGVKLEKGKRVRIAKKSGAEL